MKKSNEEVNQMVSILNEEIARACMIMEAQKILSDNDEWKNIVLVNISNFVKLKHKEHISLSSRAIFKHMDM